MRISSNTTILYVVRYLLYVNRTACFGHRFSTSTIVKQPHHNIMVIRKLPVFILCLCWQIVLLIYINHSIATFNVQKNII